MTEVANILDSEFPVDTPITDTTMSALGLACSLPDSNPTENQANSQLLDLILKRGPDINKMDKFGRTPLL